MIRSGPLFLSKNPAGVCFYANAPHCLAPLVVYRFFLNSCIWRFVHAGLPPITPIGSGVLPRLWYRANFEGVQPMISAASTVPTRSSSLNFRFSCGAGLYICKYPFFSCCPVPQLVFCRNLGIQCGPGAGVRLRLAPTPFLCFCDCI